MIGDLGDCVTFDIINQVDIWLRRYPESLVKIQHDLAKKKLFSRSGVVGLGRVFCMFKDRFKPIKIQGETGNLGNLLLFLTRIK